MDYLYLALYAILILAATIAADKSRLLVNELRWRVCKFWHLEIKWRLAEIKALVRRA